MHHHLTSHGKHQHLDDRAGGVLAQHLQSLNAQDEGEDVLQKAVENLGVSVDLQREQGRDHLHGADEQGHRQNGREKNLQISGTDGKKIAQLAFQFYVQIGSLLFCQRRWVPAPYSPGIVSGGRKRGVRRPGRIYAYYYTGMEQFGKVLRQAARGACGGAQGRPSSVPGK